MKRAIRLGRLVITWTNQATGAPLVDPCWGQTQEGRHFAGRAFHLRPWRRNRYGDRLGAPALVLGLVSEG